MGKKKLSWNVASPGMSTFIWGPLFWDLLTDLALGMDRKEKSSSSSSSSHTYTPQDIWLALRFILPCKWCRKSYSKFVREDLPRTNYVHWVWELHNKVNAKLEKPALEWNKFQRRCHIMQRFSTPDTWWNLHFILTLNYDPLTKRSAYRRWFELAPYMMSLLPYNIPCFAAALSPRTLASKFSLLQWMAAQFNEFHQTHHPLEYFVRRYAQAIAHKTPEELFQLCGYLMVRCKRYDQKCQE